MQTRSALIVLVSMLLFSIMVANVANILNHEIAYYSGPHSHSDVYANAKPMTDTDQNILWFLQISDIHISMFRDPSRIIEFAEFCDLTLNAIMPVAVLASGDLTDAKTIDNIGSKQFRQEWEYYNQVLVMEQVTEKTAWLDIRGNHDNFNVASIESRENFFPNYSIQGKAHPRSYMYQVEKNGVKVSFIAVDACLEPGPRRPFNFVGMLDKPEVEILYKIMNDVEASNSQYTVWFGHFPTSCILTDGENVRQIFRRLNQGLVYLCGHLHTLGGIVPKMYSLQKDGFLELELGDWKDNRRYRLMAIDHGMVSFVDVTHREWPVILITNPKHPLFVIPKKENLDVIKNSTHIRLLAFSLSPIKEVKLRINHAKWLECKNIEGPLYVAEWKPQMYKVGLHQMEVFVSDIDGREKIITQPFSLDGSRMAFDVLPRILLMGNASLIFKVMFCTVLIVSTVPLVILRYIHKLVKEKRISKPQMRRGCLKGWIRKLWILSTVDRLFWPLILYPIYLSFGPWSIGHIIEDHLGVIFAWGIFVHGTFLPGSFTYMYGFLQLVTFQIPIIFILAHGVDYRFHYNVIKPGKNRTTIGSILLHLPFIILLTIQIIMAYFFWVAYGTMAFLLGPLRTWSVILAIALWHQTLNLSESCTREAASIWCVKPEPNLSQTGISLNESH